MGALRTFRRFTFKDANFRICCDRIGPATDEIVRQRGLLEQYLRRHPHFAGSLGPVDATADAPEVARRMAAAARAVGVGPMATVAGTMAQLAAEAALRDGAVEAIVENGGDAYIYCNRPVAVGLFAGETPLRDRLALRIEPGQTPLAVCSSSGRMGHSLSLGYCDLATVTARDAGLADAAATHAANLVKTAANIDAALERIAAIDGVDGVLLVKGDRIGLVGRLPDLVANRDADLPLKVTRDRNSAIARGPRVP